MEVDDGDAVVALQLQLPLLVPALFGDGLVIGARAAAVAQLDAGTGLGSAHAVADSEQAALDAGSVAGVLDVSAQWVNRGFATDGVDELG